MERTGRIETLAAFLSRHRENRAFRGRTFLLVVDEKGVVVPQVRLLELLRVNGCIADLSREPSPWEEQDHSNGVCEFD